MASAQKILGDLGAQLQRMISTGTKLIAGGALYAADAPGTGTASTSGPFPNPGEAFINTITDMTRNLQGISSLLREMNGQWSRILETGTKMISG
jgi:hypothetical protein